MNRLQKFYLHLIGFSAVFWPLALYDYIFQPDFASFIYITAGIYLVIIGHMLFSAMQGDDSPRITWLTLYFMLSFILGFIVEPVAEFLFLRSSKLIKPFATQTVHHPSSKGNSYDDLIVQYRISGTEYRRVFSHYRHVPETTLRIRYSTALPRVARVEHVSIFSDKRLEYSHQGYKSLTPQSKSHQTVK